jgi:hypothetical protein
MGVNLYNTIESYHYLPFSCQKAVVRLAPIPQQGGFDKRQCE